MKLKDVNKELLKLGYKVKVSMDTVNHEGDVEYISVSYNPFQNLIVTFHKSGIEFKPQRGVNFTLGKPEQEEFRLISKYLDELS